ncbi:MAG: prepilin-type N-terminal cleavage/methylation domain-containing protein [Planctomycetota bacterium]|jgi:prepilin-type N-terminal cleavage/methylation domain-containing protein
MPHATLRAFTLTELLVVVALVVVLLSILIVAVNAAAETAQKANTQFLMTSIKQGLVRFKEDVGYYPPVLDDGRNLRPVVNPLSSSYAADVQNWFSSTTLAEYLIGYGPGAVDGYGYDGETPPLGIRHPGRDGVWGATTYGIRNPPLEGSVFGPYLELKDERLLASTNGETDPAGHLIVFSPGEGGYNPDDPKVLVDYWGMPIRYYRQPYPPGALHAAYRAVDRNLDGTTDPPPSLADVIALRPYFIKPGSESDNLDVPDAGGDTSIVLSMRTAEIGLLSAGPDRALDLHHRVDGKELNKDNIVELGP